jgi:hypothetical protein
MNSQDLFGAAEFRECYGRVSGAVLWSVRSAA